MNIDAIHRDPVAFSHAAASIVDAIFTDECHADELKVALPRPELHLMVRFGPALKRGLDIHVLGARQRVTRKVIPKGQWTIMARLRLGHANAILGAPPAAFNGHPVPVEDVWSATETQTLYDALSTATKAADAAAILERTIAARLSRGRAHAGQPNHPALIREAARQLLHANVSEVAASLNISERHLRRVFLDSVGMSPKTFARLMRFSRAMDLARENPRANWANIASAAGYYDQAHLIEDFHAFAGATPEAFLRELGTARPLQGRRFS